MDTQAPPGHRDQGLADDTEPHGDGVIRRALAPIRRSDVGWFFGAYAVLVIIWYALGRAVIASDAMMQADADVARWAVERRTPRFDRLTEIGSALSGTGVKILATAVLAGLMLAAWQRWRDPMVVILPLILEAMVFITVTYMVGRPRPDVDRLEGSPVNTSFPSGHAAAAFVYSALLIVVCWHTRTWWIRTLAGFVTVSVAIIVGMSRVYRGMHHVSDVLAGFLLGGVSILFCWWLVERVLHRTAAQPASGEPSVTDRSHTELEWATHG